MFNRNTLNYLTIQNTLSLHNNYMLSIFPRIRILNKIGPTQNTPPFMKHTFTTTNYHIQFSYVIRVNVAYIHTYMGADFYKHLGLVTHKCGVLIGNKMFIFMFLCLPQSRMQL